MLNPVAGTQKDLISPMLVLYLYIFVYLKYSRMFYLQTKSHVCRSDFRKSFYDALRCVCMKGGVEDIFFLYPIHFGDI